MQNIDIFQQTYAPHTSRVLPSFDNVNSGACSIGFIQGSYRTIPAIVTEVATENDKWKIVNLVNQDNQNFDSCGVLGAYDDEHAKELAILQVGRMFDGLATDVTETTTHALMRHLNSAQYHKKHGVIQPWILSGLQDVVSEEKAMWDGLDLVSHNGQLSGLLLDMQRHDDEHGLLSQFDGLAVLLSDLGAVEQGFDSIIVEYQYLDKFMAMLNTAMNQASKGKVQIKDVQTSKPYKRNNVAQVAVSFGMSDGQSATIVFHNPDSTPSKLAAKDTLISWKILMNNRDITGAIQPNQGEGIALPVLAGRIMSLINQNSARFTRTQAKKAENEKLLAEAQDRLEIKIGQSETLSTEIEELKIELDQIQASAKEKSENTQSAGADIEPLVEIDTIKEGLNSLISNKFGDQKINKDGNVEFSGSLPALQNKNYHLVWVGEKELNVYIQGSDQVLLTFSIDTAKDVNTQFYELWDSLVELSFSDVDPSSNDENSRKNVLFKLLEQDGFSSSDPDEIYWDANNYPMEVKFSENYDEAFIKYNGNFKTTLKNNDDDRVFVNQLTALKYHLIDLSKAEEGGVVLKAEAENAYRSIDYKVNDYQGHTSDEFKRADVKGVLNRKIEIAEAVLARKFRNEDYRLQIEVSIKNARKMIERWEQVHNPEVIDNENNGITYRYALINRPFHIGAQPTEGFLRTEKAESDISAYARHGVAVYDRALTDDLLSQFEMKLIPNSEKITEMIEAVATELTLHKNAHKFAAAIQNGGSSSLELMITKIQEEKYPNVLIARQQQFLKDVSEYFMEIYQPETTTIEENEMNPDHVYLTQIINGDINPLDADMDKIIEIGEKDETDLLFVQALEVVEKALDEATA